MLNQKDILKGTQRSIDINKLGIALWMFMTVFWAVFGLVYLKNSFIALVGIVINIFLIFHYASLIRIDKRILNLTR